MAQSNSEGYDTLKIYIGLMTGLALITTIWLIYNYKKSSDCSKAISYGITDFNKIAELIPLLPPIKEEKEKEPIENVQTFFKRAIENFQPEVSPEQVEEKRSLDDILYKEYRYEINFKTRPLSRAELVRYILVVQKANRAPHLKVKSLSMRKFQGAAPYEDRWEVESLVFAFNKEKLE